MNLNNTLYHHILHYSPIAELLELIPRFHHAYEYVHYRQNAENTLHSINDIMRESGFDEQLVLSVEKNDPKIREMHDDAESIRQEIDAMPSFLRALAHQNSPLPNVRWPIMLSLIFMMCVRNGQKKEPDYTMFGLALAEYLKQPDANMATFQFFFPVAPLELVKFLAAQSSDVKTFFSYIEEYTKGPKEGLIQILYDYGTQQSHTTTPTL